MMPQNIELRIVTKIITHKSDNFLLSKQKVCSFQLSVTDFPLYKLGTDIKLLRIHSSGAEMTLVI
jgi:hypothetical protein